MESVNVIVYWMLSWFIFENNLSESANLRSAEFEERETA